MKKLKNVPPAGGAEKGQRCPPHGQPCGHARTATTDDHSDDADAASDDDSDDADAASASDVRRPWRRRMLEISQRES